MNPRTSSSRLVGVMGVLLVGAALVYVATRAFRGAERDAAAGASDGRVLSGSREGEDELRTDAARTDSARVDAARANAARTNAVQAEPAAAAGSIEGPVESGQAGAVGTILWLRATDRAPLANLSWKLTALEPTSKHRPTSKHGPTSKQEPATEFEVVSNGAGTSEVQAGVYTASCVDGTHVVLAERVAVRPGATTVVTVQRVGELRIVVETLEGGALAGARCQWWPQLAREGRNAPPTPTVAAPFEAFSDVEGRASWSECPNEAGLAIVSADGYLPEFRSVFGRPAGPVRMRLVPRTEGGRSVEVVSTSGEPVYDAKFAQHLVDGLAVEVARARPGENRATIPAQLGADARLVASAPGMCDAEFVLGRLAGERLELSPRCDTFVEVRGGQAQFVQLLVEPESQPEPGAPMLKWRGAEFHAPGFATLELPQLVPLRVLVFSELAGMRSKTVTLSGPNARLTFDLDAAASSLSLLILDDRGEPLSAASASVEVSGGRRAEVRANAAGRIELDAAARPLSIEVNAPGFVSAVLRRTSKVADAPARDTLLELELQRAADTTLIVRDYEARPLTGLTVTVVPMVASPLGEAATRRFEALGSGWMLSASALLRGVTNERGAIALRSTPIGPLLAQVMPPTARVGPGAGVALYRFEFPCKLAPGGGPIELVCPRPRYCALEVVDGTRDRLASSFELRLANRDDGALVGGGAWQGWLPECKGLEVEIEGVGQAALEVNDLDPEALNTVRVDATEQVRLEFTGLPADDPPRRLDMRLLRTTAAGPQLVRRWRIHLEDNTASCSLPRDPQLAVGVDPVFIDGAQWSFTPESSPCDGRAVHEFELVREK